MQREKRHLLPNVPFNEISVRFRKKTNKTPKSRKLKFLKLFQLHRIKKSIKVISKWESVQRSMALEKPVWYRKTAQRQPLYGVRGLMRIKKPNILPFTMNTTITTQKGQKANKLCYTYSC